MKSKTLLNSFFKSPYFPDTKTSQRKYKEKKKTMEQFSHVYKHKKILNEILANRNQLV